MKAHLLVFDDSQIDRREVQSILNEIEEIENWYSFFGNVICLATAMTARQVSKRLRASMPTTRFIITEIEYAQLGGRLPRSIWEFLEKPQPVSVQVQ